MSTRENTRLSLYKWLLTGTIYDGVEPQAVIAIVQYLADSGPYAKDRETYLQRLLLNGTWHDGLLFLPRAHINDILNLLSRASGRSDIARGLHAALSSRTGVTLWGHQIRRIRRDHTVELAS
jgi:hypothetical protein